MYKLQKVYLRWWVVSCRFVVRNVDGATDRRTEVPVDGATDKRTEVPVDGATDRRTEVPVDGATDKRTEVPVLNILDRDMDLNQSSHKLGSIIHLFTFEAFAVLL